MSSFPVDMVYLWVDGADPAWLAQKAKYAAQADRRSNRPQRFTDNEELRYSLRSVHRFAPWVRKIFIVTNNQRPAWLAQQEKVVVVDHSQIFSNLAHLPTYNSMAIECHLHRISGLAEHFLYANDDMFFGARVRRGDFFTDNGKLKVTLDRNHRLASPERASRDVIGKGNAIRELHARAGAKATYGTLHMIKPYRKNLFEELDAKFPDLVERTSRERFRGPESVGFNLVFAHHYALHVGMAVAGSVGWVLAPMSHERRSHWLGRILARRPKLFCVNNSAPQHASEMQAFFAKLGLPQAPWEASGDPLACAHRGAELRTEACELCGSRDRREAVFACSFHGECTLRRYKSGKSQQTCLTCPQRSAP